MRIQCTKDLLKLMKKEPVVISEEKQEDPLFAWNATMFRMGRNRMMILQNSLTRCLVMLYRPMAKDFAALDDRVKEAIRLVFEEMEIPGDQIQAYLEEAGDTRVTRSGSRKDIGRLVQVCRNMEYNPYVQALLQPYQMFQTQLSVEFSEAVLWRTEDKDVTDAIMFTKETLADVKKSKENECLI